MSIPSINSDPKYRGYPEGYIITLDGFKFKRSKNSLWKLLPNKRLKSYIKRLYVDRNFTIRDLSVFSGQPHSTMQNLLNDLGFMRKKRPNSDADVFKFFGRNKDVLMTLYYTEGRNLRYITDRINSYNKIIVTESQLSDYFEYAGLEKRTQAESIRKYREVGRGSVLKRGEGVFSRPAKASWHKHLNLDLDSLTYNDYKAAVYRFTYMAINRLPHLYPALAGKNDRRNLGIKYVDLDHQFSVSNGYHIYKGSKRVKRKHIIPLCIMCHPCNLKLIPEKTNCMKGAFNNKTLKQLLAEIKKFKKKHGDIFEGYYDKFNKEDLVALHELQNRSKESLCLR